MPKAIRARIILNGPFLKRRIGKDEAKQKDAERVGTLFAAGLIVGESLIGVIMALIIALSVTSNGSDSPLALNLDNWGTISE